VNELKSTQEQMARTISTLQKDLNETRQAAAAREAEVQLLTKTVRDLGKTGSARQPTRPPVNPAGPRQ
jgi:hypothetical protein